MCMDKFSKTRTRLKHITGNEVKDTDAEIEGNKSNYLLALLLLIQCKEMEDENIIEIRGSSILPQKLVPIV